MTNISSIKVKALVNVNHNMHNFPLMLQTRRSRLITFADEFQILGYFLKAMAMAENISISVSTKFLHFFLYISFSF